MSIDLVKVERDYVYERWLTLIVYIDLKALGYCISSQFFSVESKWEGSL